MIFSSTSFLIIDNVFLSTIIFSARIIFVRFDKNFLCFFSFMSTQKGKTKMYKKETAFNLEGHSVHPTKIQNSKKQKEKCGKLSLTELFNGNTKTSSHQCRKVSTFLVYLQILKCDSHCSFFFFSLCPIC